MAISNEQLAAWAKPGALATAETTHTSVKAALDVHVWPSGMSYQTYLQGSYGNRTNIRGNSDVDVVVQASSVFYSNIPMDQWGQYNIYKGAFDFAAFKAQVLSALIDYYGSAQIDDTASDKCFLVKPVPGRVPADVIPCMEYRRYSGFSVVAEGMTFFTTGGAQIINYPKIHRENGEAKNTRTSGRFKDIVRVCKNAREALGGDTANFSSYFIECLIYNVSDPMFAGSLSQAFEAVILYLRSANLSEFKTQNGQEMLFGTSSTQWNLAQAQTYIAGLSRL